MDDELRYCAECEKPIGDAEAQSSSQAIIYAHSERTEHRENSPSSKAQTVLGVFLFFFFISRMIAAALAETASASPIGFSCCSFNFNVATVIYTAPYVLYCCFLLKFVCRKNRSFCSGLLLFSCALSLFQKIFLSSLRINCPILYLYSKLLSIISPNQNFHLR